MPTTGHGEKGNSHPPLERCISADRGARSWREGAINRIVLAVLVLAAAPAFGRTPLVVIHGDEGGCTAYSIPPDKPLYLDGRAKVAYPGVRHETHLAIPVSKGGWDASRFVSLAQWTGVPEAACYPDVQLRKGELVSLGVMLLTKGRFQRLWARSVDLIPFKYDYPGPFPQQVDETNLAVILSAFRAANVPR